MLATIRAYALGRAGRERRRAGPVRDATWAGPRQRRPTWSATPRPGGSGGTAFDAVADDLRAALAGGPGAAEPRVQPAGPLPGPPGLRPAVHGRVARALPRRPRGPRGSPGAACGDLRCRGRVAMAEGHGEVAFELLIAAAEQAACGGRRRAPRTACAGQRGHDRRPVRRRSSAPRCRSDRLRAAARRRRRGRLPGAATRRPRRSWPGAGVDRPAGEDGPRRSHCPARRWPPPGGPETRC